TRFVNMQAVRHLASILQRREFDEMKPYLVRLEIEMKELLNARRIDDISAMIGKRQHCRRRSRMHSPLAFFHQALRAGDLFADQGIDKRRLSDSRFTGK